MKNASKSSEVIQDRSLWERQYQAGRWDYLAGGEEFVRYAVISSILRRLPGPISLLDVGCGEGLLLTHVGCEVVARYTGLDIAQAALDKIQPKRAGDRYVCSSVEGFEPDENWSAIVFNEVLYYIGDPISQIQKFEKALKPGGIMIVSIFKKPRFWAYNNRCARRIKNYFADANYEIVEAVEISKIYRKLKWQIYVVKPPGSGGAEK